MDCPPCSATATTERPSPTAQGYRQYRCLTCKRGFIERTGTIFNRLQYPTDVVCLVVLWRLRYKLSLRDLAEMFLDRGIEFCHDAVHEWESKLANVLARGLRRFRPLATRRIGSPPMATTRIPKRSMMSWDQRSSTGRTSI